MSTVDAITVSQVSKQFGQTQALSNVSLSVRRGESRALIGRNGAGKSTLVAILTGLLQPDSGHVKVSGDSSAAAPAVGCVYQRSMLVPAATVAENIALGRFPRRAGFIDWRAVRRSASDALRQWGCEHLVNKIVDDLEPVERKIVEICRVLSLGPRVLLLDEPTAGLDRAATRRLFRRIEEARQREVSVLYISHHLHEIFDVCDSVSVLRDGRVVLTDALAHLTTPELVESMVGAAGPAPEQPATAPSDDSAGRRVVASAIELTAGAHAVDVTFDLYSGECVGLTGLDGAGHIQVAETLTGQRRPTGGKLVVGGRGAKFSSVRDALSSGIGFTPEDRQTSGFVPGISVAENATLGYHYRLTNGLGLLSRKKRDALFNALATEWDIKTWGPQQLTEELSGGNQQKVVLARSVVGSPDLLVLMNPTAGVDVAAKESIYRSIRKMQAAGRAILIVTSDDSDLAICDRVLAMYRGRIVKEMRGPVSEGLVAAAVQGPARGSALNNAGEGQGDLP